MLRKVCNGWNSHAIAIEKFSGFGPDAKSVAVFDKMSNKANPLIALAAGAGRTILWVAGAGNGVLALEDKGGGIRVDLQGNIYVGQDAKPEGMAPLPDLATDEVAKRWNSSVVKFGPKGGAILGLKDSESKLPDAPKIGLDGKRSAENALNIYSGLGPVSGAGPGGNSSCCVCRVPRFDVDRFGRLAIPSAFSAKVLYYDNAGNLIGTIGNYGNFDSQYVNPASDAGRAGKPTVALPEIPVAWPSGAGFTENSIYLCDTYNRRVVRVDKTFRAEASCAIP